MSENFDAPEQIPPARGSGESGRTNKNNNDISEDEKTAKPSSAPPLAITCDDSTMKEFEKAKAMDFQFHANDKKNLEDIAKNTVIPLNGEDTILDLCELDYSDDDLEVAQQLPSSEFESTSSRVASLPPDVSLEGYGKQSEDCNRSLPPAAAAFQKKAAHTANNGGENDDTNAGDDNEYLRPGKNASQYDDVSKSDNGDKEDDTAERRREDDTDSVCELPNKSRAMPSPVAPSESTRSSLAGPIRQKRSSVSSYLRRSSLRNGATDFSRHQHRSVLGCKQRLTQLDENSRRPGAYAVEGRAVGQIPAFAREYLTWDSNQVDQSSTIPTRESGTLNRSNGLASELIVEVIDSEALHNNIRRNILRETTQAEIVTVDNGDSEAKQKQFFLKWACALFTVLGLVIGLSIGLSREEDHDTKLSSPTIAPTYNPLPTLEIIESNDVVRCGIGWIRPLEIDMCRALAAAALGDPNKIEPVNITYANRWEMLEKNRTIDVVTIVSTHTMDRDVQQKDVKNGFTFSAPVYFDGAIFKGRPEYVECANRLDTYFGNCNEIRICVSKGSTAHDLLMDYVPDFNIRPVGSQKAWEDMFMSGRCNVYFGYMGDAFNEARLREIGYNGTFTYGSATLTKEPSCAVTREDDPVWSSFVNWVLRAIIAAEEHNITNTTASKFMTTSVFGEKYEGMFVNAIKAVGNYGDFYERHMENLAPRKYSKYNLLNNGSTGLHYGFPIGQEEWYGPDPAPGSTLYSLTKELGELRCGILERPGFGEVEMHNKSMTKLWKGMDAEYCYALSAALFRGGRGKVEFVIINNATEGYQLLNSGKVDVIAGISVTLEGDVKEASTGKGYEFSIPYFYEVSSPTEMVDGHQYALPSGNLALVTREDDPQWSDFVFWVVSATIIAEERFIVQSMHGDMEEAKVFGPSFRSMLRQVIQAVGNYGEIYDRSIGRLVPRQGRNLLNADPSGPQHFSFFGK